MTAQVPGGTRLDHRSGVAIALTLVLLRPQAAPPQAPSVQFSIDNIASRGVSSDFAVSPDGSTLAIVVSGRESRPAIWIRPMGAAAPRTIPGTEDATTVFWSPDGSSIGFTAGEQIRHSPDDRTLVFNSNRAGLFSWYQKAAKAIF
jgi:Tol biopolymer transport system component